MKKKIILCGNAMQFDRWCEENGETSGTVVYGSSPDRIQGTRASEVITLSPVNTLSGWLKDAYSQSYDELGESFFDVIIFQQFTGLLDKNGKEIYEGDIVNCIEPVGLLKPSKADYEQMDFIGVIEFDNEGADYNIQGKNDLRGLGTGKQILEIIGNIYESPNLLSPSINN